MPLRDLLMLSGAVLFCAGLWVNRQNEIIAAHQAILYDVACDNMALRMQYNDKVSQLEELKND